MEDLQDFRLCKWVSATPGIATLQSPNITLNLMPGHTYTLDIQWDVVRQWIKNGLLEVVEEVAIAPPQKTKKSSKEVIDNAN